MPRTLSSALTLAKNAVASTDPFVWVYELNSPDFPAPLRFVSDVQSIVYQGLTYDPMPIDISAVQENSMGEKQTLQATVANVDQQVISLLNTYFDAVVDPNWTLSIWQVLRSSPNEVPTTDAEVFEILSADTDLLTTTFEMQALGIPSRQRSTGRRYTSSSGFENLPRVGRLYA